MREKLNIAIISPSKNAYSETFIQAHKQLLNGKVYYYHGSKNNLQLEGYGSILTGAKRLIGKGVDKLFTLNQRAEDEALLASFRKNKIDVVLAEYGTTAAIYLNVIRKAKLPLLIHFHGYDASKKETLQQFEKAYHAMFSYAKKIIAVSTVMYKKLLDIGCPQEKLILNTYGPNDLFFKNEPQFSKPQLLFIGRFTDKKAPYYTIMAFNKALKKFPDAKLIMAGSGNLMNVCENMVNYYKIQDSVKFVGVISPEEFLGYLGQSLALVQHSITARNGDMEGTPLAILEASAAGLPVISTKHAGIPDVIIHDKTGLLGEEHDVESMSQYMMTLLADPMLAKAMGAAGRENIKTNFSMKRHIESLNELLEQSIEE